MKNIYYTLLLISFSTVVHSDENSEHSFKPKLFVQQYIEDFNQQKDINRFFNFPSVWLVDDSAIPRIENNANKQLIDYENLKKTGWVKSIINDLKVVRQSENRVFILLDFSRLDSNNNQILRSEVMYTITKREDAWGISLIASTKPFIR